MQIYRKEINITHNGIVLVCLLWDAVFGFPAWFYYEQEAVVREIHFF